MEILHYHNEKNSLFNSDKEMSCDDHVINQEVKSQIATLKTMN